jgi:hypothetical protein
MWVIAIRLSFNNVYSGSKEVADFVGMRRSIAILSIFKGMLGYGKS